MAIKIMEVLEKKPDYKSGKLKLVLGDTNYETFAKTFASVPSQTFMSLTDGDWFGYQSIRDLFLTQDTYNTRLMAWLTEINIWSASVSNQNGRGDLPEFVTPLYWYDYSAEYSEYTTVDWNVLNDIVNAEKGLYDFTMHSQNHIRELGDWLGQWTTTGLHNYGSSLGEIQGLFEYYTTTNWSFQSADYGLSGYTDGAVHDRSWLTCAGLSSIPLGQTGTVHFRAGNNGYIYIDITRNSLGSQYTADGTDDGYYTWAIRQTGMEAVREWPTMHSNSGVPSAHFDWTNVVQPSMAWIKSRDLSR